MQAHEIKAKWKSNVNREKTNKATGGNYQMVQQLSVPVTLDEYLLGEWFIMVEEEEGNEEVLYSDRTIIIDIDF